MIILCMNPRDNVLGNVDADKMWDLQAHEYSITRPNRQRQEIFKNKH